MHNAAVRGDEDFLDHADRTFFSCDVIAEPLGRRRGHLAGQARTVLSLGHLAPSRGGVDHRVVLMQPDLAPFRRPG